MRRTFTVKLELDLNEGKDLSQVYERFDKSLRIIEEAFGIEASIRGNKVLLQGKEKSVKRAQKLIKELQTINSNGYILNPEDIKYIIKSIDDAAFEDPSLSLKEFFFTHVPVSSKKKFIVPRSETQKKYIETIKKYDMVIGIGPAGTGKTYLAMAMAINALLKKQVSRIIL
ncbi:MAG: PhoH family protein, partial [Thermodesulfovibrionia bacterium]|nr:PhoH family protein [Thermodesulfovibrionia bacterium]